MILIKTKFKTRIIKGFAVVFLLACVAVSPLWLGAQSIADSPNPAATSRTDDEPDFRIEKIPVAGGAELITIFAKPGDAEGLQQNTIGEIPFVSILRDTLGDERRENDRLRYVWMLTYTKASFWQKASAFVPFLYTRTVNKKDVGNQPPPILTDIKQSNKTIWNTILWTVFKKLVLSELGVVPRATATHYRQNVTDYHRTAIANALTILSLYESVEGEKLLSDAESKDIQARLWLTDKAMGWHMQSENLHRVYEKEIAKSRDIRGHNWELLRQYSESQGLYFEPLEMPDGTARHAIVWAAAEDLAVNSGRKFDGRFLNIKNPWNDSKLANWKGYSKTQWFDEENRVVEAETPNAKPRAMIPLALYGLDHPKIPIILVDFRDNGNAKRREMSKRILNDLTSDVLSLSRFSSVPYFFGRYIYEFATGRRGMDINQTSRLRSYAQLKMLLALDAGLDTSFRDEIAHRLENVSLNPLENDLEVEAKLARDQYRNLIEYARAPDGLPAKLDRERREEMVKLAHNRKEQRLYDVAHFLSFGIYTHREKATPELIAMMDVRRQLDYHERVLREIAFNSAKPEVDSDVAALKQSLRYVSENGAAAKEKTARALGKIFSITGDDEMRVLCLTGLYRIDNSTAKKELLAIYASPKIDDRWRNLCALYLKRALVEGQQISARDAAVIAGIASN